MTDLSNLRERLEGGDVGLLRDLRGRVQAATIWSIGDARRYRALHDLGLVRIVKAPDAPRDGAKAQPYFGVKIKAAGRSLLRALEASSLATLEERGSVVGEADASSALPRGHAALDATPSEVAGR